jgi:Planctomycete cytochrome C
METEEKGFRRVVRLSAELSELQIATILRSKWRPWKSERLERTAAKMLEANKRTSRPNRERLPEFKRLFWFILVPLFAWCGHDGKAQTLVTPRNVPWQQVNFSSCGGTRTGTALNIAQIRQPQPSALQAKPARNPLERPMSGPFSGPPKRAMAIMQITSACWPADLQDNAWSIISTKCTRCHGETGPPPDTLLTFQNIKGELGNLDLRTFASMRTGGNRGPAVVPGNSAASLIYRFTSLLISIPPTEADVQALDALDLQFPRMAVLMPPYPMALQPVEIAALKDWIDAGCPMVR